jgi:hypothetical protein
LNIGRRGGKTLSRIVEHLPRKRAGSDHTSWRKKRKPGGGNAGSDFVVIGVYGFKYAAWLLLMTPEGDETLLVFLLQPIFSFLVLLFSCSSITFLNLTEPFAISHRFLLFAHSLVPGWGPTTKSKTYANRKNCMHIRSLGNKLGSMPQN